MHNKEDVIVFNLKSLVSSREIKILFIPCCCSETVGLRLPSGNMLCFRRDSIVRELNIINCSHVSGSCVSGGVGEEGL